MSTLGCILLVEDDPKDVELTLTALGSPGDARAAERIGARLRILSGVALGTEVQLCVPSRVAFEPSEVRAPC